MELAKLPKGYAFRLPKKTESRKSVTICSPFVRVSSTLLACVLLFTQEYQWKEEEYVQEVELLSSVTNYIRYDSASSWSDSCTIECINSLAGILSCSLPGAFTDQHFKRGGKEIYLSVSHSEAQMWDKMCYSTWSFQIYPFSWRRWCWILASHRKVMLQWSTLVGSYLSNCFSRAKLWHQWHLPKFIAQIKRGIQSLCPVTVWS